jgi:hypothetical protein
LKLLKLVVLLIYYITLILFISFTLLIIIYIVFNKSIRNNLDILPIIIPNECKAISTIYKSLLVILALTSIKHGGVDATPMWCNVHQGGYVDGQFTGPVIAKVLCNEEGGITRTALVGVTDNDHPFTIKENSKSSPALPLWCVVSSVSGVVGAYNTGWGCEHQNMMSISQCKKISTLVIAMSAPLSGGTCASWSVN